MTNPQEAELVKDIQYLVSKHIAKVKVTPLDSKIVELQETIDFMVTTVLSQITYGKDLIEDTKKSNLILGQLEAEGYVRACLTIKHTFDNWSTELSSVIKQQEGNNNEVQ